MKEIVTSKKNPIPVGPYSQAVKVGSVCYTSGQLPYNMEIGEFELKDIEKATILCLESINNICTELGRTKEDIVKCTILIKDINKYSLVNKIYGEFFDDNYPARTAYEVSNLPFDVPIEIEAIISVKK